CHAEVLLLLSFSYRVWVLSKEDIRPSISRANLLKIIFASTLLSWIALVGLYKMCSFDIHFPPYANLTYCVLDVGGKQLFSSENLLVRATIAYFLCVFTSMLIAIVTLRRILIKQIFEL
ncbi:hypothetical protein PMAYCL1PPCAC_21651, partial [Pristionchus mayeri]